MNGKSLPGLIVAIALVTVALVRATSAQDPQPYDPSANAGTAFTYQGYLKDGGAPANGTYDFQFDLYTAALSGTFLGSASAPDVTVANGFFTAKIDFGAGKLNGEDRWLYIKVRPGASGGAYSGLTPLQQLTPAPIALSLPGLYTQQNATSPNLVGGYSGNSTLTGVTGATIGGGGVAGGVNYVSDHSGTVGGGRKNTAGNSNATLTDADDATVGGGYGNVASHKLAVVAGGYNNTASGYVAAVGGGFGNVASGTGASVGGGGYDGTTWDGNEATGNASTIGGGFSNTAGETASTVGGGAENTAGGSRATVGGGGSNVAPSSYSTVGGGNGNSASGQFATIGGGNHNTTAEYYGAIAGGTYNSAEHTAFVGGGDHNNASGYLAAIGGGKNNTAGGSAAFVGGGGYDGTTTSGNQATGKASTIGGGLGNSIPVTGTHATIGGGYNNVAGGIGAFVGGGGYDGTSVNGNQAGGNASTIGGGVRNAISSEGTFATISGGGYNDVSEWYATVGGGGSNDATGYAATVPGGQNNTAAGSYSFAAGRRAKANADGNFTFADGNAFDFESSTANSFRVRSTGGARFVLGIDGTGATTWSCVVTNGASWSCSSDRNLKENLVAADGRETLERLSSVPVFQWNARGTDPNVKHMGPMAQDFRAAFGLGDDDKLISTIDLDGVALASVQGLYDIAKQQRATITSLEARVAMLEKALLELQSRTVSPDHR